MCFRPRCFATYPSYFDHIMFHLLASMFWPKCPHKCTFCIQLHQNSVKSYATYIYTWFYKHCMTHAGLKWFQHELDKCSCIFSKKNVCTLNFSSESFLWVLMIYYTDRSSAGVYWAFFSCLSAPFIDKCWAQRVRVQKCKGQKRERGLLLACANRLDSGMFATLGPFHFLYTKTFSSL